MPNGQRGKQTIVDDELEKFSLESDRDASIIEVNESLEISMLLNQSSMK